MDWESESFEVPHIVAPTLANKWDGEDEEENVKESWEDDEEEKKREEQAARKTAATSAQSKKPKTKLMEKLEERERREREQREGSSKEKEEPDFKNMTSDEIHAEKLRRQKLQEEADLELAKEMLGISEEYSVDKLHPKTSEDFLQFQEALLKKILLYKKSEHFNTFAEDLIREICVNLPSVDLKKLKITLDNIYNEKVKQEKAKQQKPKAKTKAKLRMDEGLFDEYSAYTVTDYDDFM